MKLTKLFDQAIDLDPAERKAFLQSISERDAELAKSLERLLESEVNDNLVVPDPVALKAFASQVAQGIPMVVDDFRLLKPLGRGGMGEVWHARRQVGAAEQDVAIKFLRMDLSSRDAVARFRLEQMAIASMDHPYIARMIDAKCEEGASPWIAMEYVDGMPIAEWCKAQRLSVNARVELLIKVLEAVGHAHRHLIVHRDLKSSNVMITRDGIPKLLDFGIAKRMSDLNETATSERFFSMGIVAPEQYQGERSTVATDVYQLGMLSYEILTGCPAFQFKDLPPAKIQEQVLHGNPVLPSEACTAAHAQECGFDRLQGLQRALRGDLDRIILHALRKVPKERYAGAAEFARDLEAFLQGRPVSAVGQNAWYRSKKFLRRYWMQSGLAALAMVAVLALMVQLLRRDIVLTQAKEQALVARDQATKERDKAESLNSFLLQLFRSVSPIASDKKDLPAIVLEAIDVQIETKAFHVDPSAALALSTAALGLGELATAKRMIGALDQERERYSSSEQRQLLFIKANAANIDADMNALKRINGELAKNISNATAEQKALFIGYVCQTIISKDPALVIKITNIKPLPASLVRLRARAFSRLNQSDKAIEVLNGALYNPNLVITERLAVAQGLSVELMKVGDYNGALKQGDRMLQEVEKTFSKSNLRRLPYGITYSNILIRLGRFDDAQKILKELLLLEGLDVNSTNILKVSIAIAGSLKNPIDEETVDYARDLLNRTTPVASYALGAALLVQFRVDSSQGQLDFKKECIKVHANKVQLGEPEDSEIAIWCEIARNETSALRLTEFERQLQRVNSKDERLRLIIHRKLKLINK